MQVILHAHSAKKVCVHGFLFILKFQRMYSTCRDCNAYLARYNSEILIMHSSGPEIKLNFSYSFMVEIQAQRGTDRGLQHPSP